MNWSLIRPAGSPSGSRIPALASPMRSAYAPISNAAARRPARQSSDSA